MLGEIRDEVNVINGRDAAYVAYDENVRVLLSVIDVKIRKTVLGNSKGVPENSGR